MKNFVGPNVIYAAVYLFAGLIFTLAVPHTGEITKMITSSLIYVTMWELVVLSLILMAPIPYTPLIGMIKLCISAIFLIGNIFIYGNYRCQHPEFKDPLEKPLFDEKLPWLDGWSYIHFMTNFLLGFLIRLLFRSEFVKKEIMWHYLIFCSAFFVLGIAWEVFEHVVGKERPGWMGGYGGCNMATDKNEDGNWWYGKWTDILMNGTGMILGIAFSMMLFK